MKKDLNHQNIRKICSITAILVLFLAAAPLAVKGQEHAYPPGEWKFKIVDDWGLWGNSAAKYDPVTGPFGAVAYLYNTTVPADWNPALLGPYDFEDWKLIKKGEADKDGWVTIPELPGDAWDRSPVPGHEHNYTLVIKLKIGNKVTSITIFNATVLKVGVNLADVPQSVGLYDMLNRTTIRAYLGLSPQYNIPDRNGAPRTWITSPRPVDFTETVGGVLYGGYKVWMYYVALQPLDEFGFPITGAKLDVIYRSDLGGYTYGGGTWPAEVLPNKRVNPVVDAAYGTWFTNGSLGKEFIPDTSYIYHADYSVGWVVLRVPLINSTPLGPTAPDWVYKSSLVTNMTFIWRYKTGTPINVTKYYVLEPTAGVSGAPWLNRESATPPAVGMYSNYLGTLRANSTHQVNATVRWAMLNLTDCFGNNWWTVKAEAYAFDTADKNQYMLMAASVAPGRRLLRYPVPVPPFGNTTLVLGVEWYYSLVNVSKWKVGYLDHPAGGGPFTIYDELNPAGWKDEPSMPFGVIHLYTHWWYGGLWYWDDVDEQWVWIIDPNSTVSRTRAIRNNMTWVDVNFWSETELPEQPPDFAAKIWLPSTIGFRKAEPLTVWWNGRNGFVVLPDMEYYAGPNPSTLTELDPYDLVSHWLIPFGTPDMGEATDFLDFWYVMTHWGGSYGGNGWLPTRAVGWVDFEAWYEGVKVMDTYADGKSLKLECCNSTIEVTYNDEPYPAIFPPPYYTSCHFNLTMKIYEIGFHIILESCGSEMDQELLTGIPFFFKHPSPLISEYGMIGPKAVTHGKVDVVKAPYGNYSNFVIVWHMSLLKPYKIEYLLDNGTTIELKEPILLNKNMRNIQLRFSLWNLTIDTWSHDPFRLINVNVTLFSVSDFGIAPGLGISKRQIDIITDPENIAYKHVLPPGWVKYYTTTDEYGFPKIYYYTDTQTNKWNSHPSWTHMPEKEYWIWVRVPGWDSKGTVDTGDDVWDPDLAERSGFRRVDANATLYWSGDPWNKPLYLNQCYGWVNPLIVKTYVYDPKIALKTACGEPLVFDETMSSALILAEPWYSDAEPKNLFYRQQIDPYNAEVIGTPGGMMPADYNAYLIRANKTDGDGIAKLYSVNATDPDGKGTYSPTDDNLWNPVTGWKARVYPNQSRYLIGYSPGLWPVVSKRVDYRMMVYYKGVLVFNDSIVLSNPYDTVAEKTTVVKTSVYPYVFRAVNDPLEGPGKTVFGIAKLKVTVYWAGLNTTFWPTKHLAYETAPIEFSLLNASKIEKAFNMSVVQRLWGPPQIVTVPLETIPYQPVPPYFSSMVVVESKKTDDYGKATFLIPVWNYSVTPRIYTWYTTDGIGDGVGPNILALDEHVSGPRNPWNKVIGPLSINLITAGLFGNRTGALFGTPVYANFTTIPGETNNIPEDDVERPVGALYASKYCRWIQLSMNATGLINPASKVWKETGCVSVNTTYRAAYRPYWWAGVGMLSGGAYQGRAPDSETGTTVSQGEDGCYAKAEEKVLANDVGIVVRNLDKVGLPNQKVAVVRDPVYLYAGDGKKSYLWFDGAETVKITGSALLLEDWTPTVPNAPPADYYILYLRSKPNSILWGLYNLTLKTENLTRGMSNTLLKLNDPQFLTYPLFGGVKDWGSTIVYLDWPARLKVTILTEDGRPIEKAWVYVVEGYTRGNVTAAITDTYGHAGTLFVGLGNAPPSPSIYMEPGDRVDIGFNLLRGWYWVNADRALTGVAVNPNWDYYTNEHPPQPSGDEYIQYIHYGTDGVKEGWARFYGRYYVVVYYKPKGCSEVLGPVMSEVVFDSYTDEPQHQYIYLGVYPETRSGEASWSASQAKTFRPYVNDLRISFQDGMNRPLTHVTGGARHPKYGWEGLLTLDSGDSNTVTLTMVPLRPGTSYAVHAEWTSVYGTKAVVDSSVKDLYSVVTLPVFDVTLRLVTPRGSSLVGVGVKVAGVDVGATSATGEVLVTQIPSGTYAVSAKWLDTDLNVPSLVVTTNGAVTLTPSNVHLLTVAVRGAQGQALEGATVRVTKGAVEITKLTDKDGKAEIELPDASYNIAASYGQFTGSSSVSLTADKIVTINLDVFIELFGVGMSMAQFLLFIVMIVVIVIVLAIVLHEYHIYRRKRLPQLFGAPAGPK